MVGLRTWILLTIGLLLLTACPGRLPDVQITLDPPSEILETQVLRTPVVKVKIIRNNGFSGPVQLSVEAVDPPNGVGSASNQIGVSISPIDAQGLATLSFEIRPQVAPGIYHLLIKATAATANATTKLQLVVFKDSLLITATPDTVIQNDTPEPASVVLSARLGSGVSGSIKWSLEGPGSLSANSGNSVNYLPPTGCVATARSAEVKATLEGGTNPGLAERKTITLAPSNRGVIKITIANIPAGLQPEVTVGGEAISGNSATLTLSAGIQPVNGKGLAESGIWVDGFWNLPVTGLEVKGCVNPDQTLSYVQRGRKIWLAGAGGLRRLGDNASLVEPANTTAGLFSAPSAAVVDKAGNLYVANQAGSTLTRFSVAALQTSTTLPQYTLSSTGLNQPTGLALDVSGNLWVANHGSNTLVRFARTDLEPLGGASTLNPKPNLVIKAEGEVLRGLWGMAFNNAGDLFVSLFDQEELVRIPAAKLSGASPITLKENEVFRVENLTGPKGLAFDAQGRLWVAEYTGGALIGVGNNFSQPLEAIRRDLSLTILSDKLQRPLNLAFDKPGKIWVVSETGKLLRFEAVSGIQNNPLPSHTLDNPLAAIALDVHPAGLPLNGRP